MVFFKKDEWLWYKGMFWKQTETTKILGGGTQKIEQIS
jgi:hypothetical protein